MPDRKADYEVNKTNPYPQLSQGMRKVIDYQSANAQDAFNTNVTWDQLRENYVKERKFWNEGGPAAFNTVELAVDGPQGPVPLRIYYPDGKPQHRAIVFFHGGGFTVGSNDTHDRMMRCLMAASGAAVIGVDYRLAPEYKFPVPLYESAAVCRYFQENGGRHGILPDKLGLGGDSGGANLALGVNLYLRDTPGGNDFIAALLLYYGAFGLEDSPSHRLHGSLLDGMRRTDLASYMNYYTLPEDKENPYFACFGNDLTFGVPPAYMCCGALDPLLDDSLLLKEILNSHGVRTQLDIVPGALHAYMHYGRMMDEAVTCLNNSGAFYKAVAGA
jgi:acetyl esterase